MSNEWLTNKIKLVITLMHQGQTGGHSNNSILNNNNQQQPTTSNNDKEQ